MTEITFTETGFSQYTEWLIIDTKTKAEYGI